MNPGPRNTLINGDGVICLPSYRCHRGVERSRQSPLGAPHYRTADGRGCELLLQLIVLPPTEAAPEHPIYYPPNAPAGDWVMVWWPGLGWV
jgi:hypothetical protein